MSGSACRQNAQNVLVGVGRWHYAPGRHQFTAPPPGGLVRIFRLAGPMTVEAASVPRGVDSRREVTRARSGYRTGAVRGAHERGLALAQLCPLRPSVRPPPLGRSEHRVRRLAQVVPGAVVPLRGVDVRARAPAGVEGTKPRDDRRGRVRSGCGTRFQTGSIGTKMECRSFPSTFWERWPLPEMSSTRMTSPASMTRVSPSLAVNWTPPFRLMMYWRLGPGASPGRSRRLRLAEDDRR